MTVQAAAAAPAVAPPPQVPPKAEEPKIVAPAAAVPPPAAPAVKDAAKADPVAAPPGSMLGEADPKKPEGDQPAKADYSKLKLPDGAMIAPTAVAEIQAIAEKHKLSPEAAQAWLEDRNASVKTYHDGLLESHRSTVDANKEKLKAHPVLGGQHLKATDDAITGVMSRFAPKGLMERVQSAGYNWDPDFVQFLKNIDEATKDDTFVQGGGKVSQKPKGLESIY